MLALHNAVVLAQRSWRALVLPPVLSHFDVTKGRCPHPVPAATLRARVARIQRLRPRLDQVSDMHERGAQ
jgi:hypothetical protein